jgi:hypothetical protein
MVTKTKLSSSGTEVPDWAYKAMASCPLPIIQEYYATEEGKHAFAEWKAKQLEAKETSGQETVKGEASNASPLLIK